LRKSKNFFSPLAYHILQCIKNALTLMIQEKTKSRYIMKLSLVTIIAVFLLAATSCTQKTEFSANFDNTHNRIWVGKDF